MSTPDLELELRGPSDARRVHDYKASDSDFPGARVRTFVPPPRSRDSFRYLSDLLRQKEVGLESGMADVASGRSELPLIDQRLRELEASEVVVLRRSVAESTVRF